MKLVLLMLAATCLFELGLYLSAIWHLRRWLAILAIGLVTITTSLFLLKNYSLWLVLWAFFAIYRIVNLGRLIEDRLQTDYLHREAWRSSLWLIGLQWVTLAVAFVSSRLTISAAVYWYMLAVSQLLVAIVTIIAFWRRLRASRPVGVAGLADKDLPTLSVAIPARNETDDLEECLKSLLSSNYPKLEILVLDDCSQNKHTPEIIRRFAHDGVRFIAGEVPPEHWAAKNFAYKQLAEVANGDIILFCGVDLRFEPSSLRALTELMQQTGKSMISLMPRNIWPAHKQWRSLLTQPDRYIWEVALPRSRRRPPVLSTCWLITTKALRKSGGFAAIERKNSPESYFARLAAADNGYSFIISDEALGLSCAKRLDEQLATATRTRYPQLHRKPEMVALVGAAEILLLLAPLHLFIVSLLYSTWLLAAISGIALLLQAGVYTATVRLTYRRFIWRSLLLFPIAVLYDLALLDYSLWRYEFNQVLWKGRNVCLPLMYAYAALPKL